MSTVGGRTLARRKALQERLSDIKKQATSKRILWRGAKETAEFCRF
jgi:hypothetical protein